MSALDSQQLATLAAVVQEGSFDAAARALHVTPSAVSQRIKALEQDVGQVLVRRAKPCRATDAGRPLLRLAGQIALLEREALAEARGAPATRVAMVANGDSLATWFLPALAALPAHVLVDVRVEDQDHTAELLRDGTVMAAVTSQPEAVQGCRVERLGAMRYRAVVAPGFAARAFPDGPAPAAFAAAPVILVDRRDRLQHQFAQKLGLCRPDPPVHYVQSVWGFCDAIRLGLGWGMMPEQLAAPDLAAGRLAELAPGRFLDVPLHWQHWRLDSTVLAALTEAVRAAAREALR
jgi:LysR family transcriptional regulator, chromosome initiation inhibitor